MGVAYVGTYNYDGAEEQYQFLKGLDMELANKLLNLIDKTLESVETGETNFSDAIIKQCPYCGYEASVKHFGTWEKAGKRSIVVNNTSLLIKPSMRKHPVSKGARWP